MAIYAIGDVQGCYGRLMALLETLPLGEGDEVWLTGDLVNRGPGSLEVLRWAMRAPLTLRCVLGNHDLWAMACAISGARPRRGDTLDALLAASDRDACIEWLRNLPLVHADANHLLVHAGLLPDWDADKAVTLAREVEAVLRGGEFPRLLQRLGERRKPRWDDSLTGIERIEAALAVFTRLRVCTRTGEPDFAFSASPEEIPDGYYPWFDVPGRVVPDRRIVFGHWAALGLFVRNDVLGLDTGCVWGRALTAVRLGDSAVFSVSCRD